MNHIDPEAIKAFWWMVSWGGAIILSTIMVICQGAIAIIIAAWLGLKIVGFIKEVF